MTNLSQNQSQSFSLQRQNTNFSQMSSQMNSETNQSFNINETNDRNEFFGLDGTRLIPVSQLPVKYRSVFINRFPHFNCVQSKVFEDILYSDKSIGYLFNCKSKSNAIIFHI